MEKKRNGQTIIIAVLAVAILFMSVGFAAYSTVLHINGNVQVAPSKWDIHWDSSTYAASNDSVDILDSSLTANSSPTLSNDTVSFGARLAKPGDKAEFTINAVNAGTFDAKLSAIGISGISATQAEYLDFSVTYAGQVYTASTSNLNISLPAGQNNTVTVKVTALYKQPNDPANLPSGNSDVTINPTVTFTYDQVTS